MPSSRATRSSARGQLHAVAVGRPAHHASHLRPGVALAAQVGGAALLDREPAADLLQQLATDEHSSRIRLAGGELARVGPQGLVPADVAPPGMAILDLIEQLVPRHPHQQSGQLLGAFQLVLPRRRPHEEAP